MYKVKNGKIDSRSCDVSKCIIVYYLISNKKKIHIAFNHSFEIQFTKIVNLHETAVHFKSIKNVRISELLKNKSFMVYI